MNEELKRMRDVAVEDFGKAYNNWGLSKLKGRIVGLLLFNQKPLSLDDIANDLHVTKGSVSTIARQLEEGGLIRKVWVKGDRKDYYEIVSDVFRTTSEHNLKLLKDNLFIAQKYINFLSGMMNSASPEGKLELEVYLDRMAEMQEFYALLVDMFERFITEWTEKFEVAVQ